MISEILKPDDARWKTVLSDCCHDFYHLPEYVRLEADRLCGEPAAFLTQDQHSFFLLPLIIRPISIGESNVDIIKGYDAISPYGYPSPLIKVDDNANIAGEFIKEAFEHLRNEMSARDICSAFIRMHPILSDDNIDFSQAGILVEHGETVLIDLSVSFDEMWNMTRSTYRNNILNMRKAGLTVVLDEGFEHLEDFTRIYLDTMQYLSADESYLFDYNYFIGLKKALGSRMKLCMVKYADSVVAAGLFTESCGIVQYHLSGAKSEFKDGTKLMLDFIRHWAKERGNRWFHFGGGVGAKNDSLFFFKSGFSKQRAKFKTLRMVFNQALFKEACDIWQRESGIPSDDSTGFFPPYRKPIILL